MSKPRAWQKANALAKLGVTPAQVAAQPAITPILKRAGIARKVLEYLGGSPDPDAKRFLGTYEGLTAQDKRGLSLEAVALAAGLTTERLFEVIAGAVFTQSKYVAALLAAASHPEVVARSIERALEEPRTITNPDGTVRVLPPEDGLADRKMLHQQAGFLPLPKTQFLNLPGVKSIDARTQTVTVLPPVESSVKRMADRFGEKLLGPVPEVPEVEDFDPGTEEDE
ncbi:MAG: hypothetical protein ABH877_03415 [bacterium]